MAGGLTSWQRSISSVDGETLLALRAGAREFLTQPVALEDLVRGLQRLAYGGMGSEGLAGATSEVIAVMGSRGSVGCTALAVNLGCNLAQEPVHSVVLVDLALALGNADVALDLTPDHTLADLARNIERLDMHFLKRTLCQHASGLALLARPVRIEDVALIHEEHLRQVIGLLCASHTHVILDLSKSFTVTDHTALHIADVILLVVQLELSSLRNAVRILTAMSAEEGLGDKIKVVINRVGSDFREGSIT